MAKHENERKEVEVSPFISYFSEKITQPLFNDNIVKFLSQFSDKQMEMLLFTINKTPLNKHMPLIVTMKVENVKKAFFQKCANYLFIISGALLLYSIFYLFYFQSVPNAWVIVILTYVFFVKIAYDLTIAEAFRKVFILEINKRNYTRRLNEKGNHIK